MQNSQESTCIKVSFLIKLQDSGTGVFLWIYRTTPGDCFRNKHVSLLLSSIFCILLDFCFPPALLLFMIVEYLFSISLSSFSEWLDPMSSISNPLRNSNHFLHNLLVKEKFTWHANSFIICNTKKGLNVSYIYDRIKSYFIICIINYSVSPNRLIIILYN